MQILGVRVDNLEKKEILEKIEEFLVEEKFHQIATVNPEFVLTTQKDSEFKEILNNCDLNIADGVGLKFAFWLKGEKLKARIAGVDLMREIIKVANNRGLSIFLVTNKDGLSSWKETRDAMLKIYPSLKVEGVDLDVHDTKYLIHDTDIVFCNFGAPYQEIFLNRQKNAIVRIAMGVGGSFDFLTGKLRRAPVFMRKVGLEWLFRLIQQPGRYKRIFNAVLIFPIKLIFKFKYNDNQNKAN